MSMESNLDCGEFLFHYLNLKYPPGLNYAFLSIEVKFCSIGGETNYGLIFAGRQDLCSASREENTFL